MFKKALIVCAGLVLSGSLARAVDVSGSYSGQSEGHNVSVTLSSQDGVVRGQVVIGNATLPLVGREVDGRIQGMWRGRDGQDYPFAATAGADGLRLQTNGMTYSLARGGSSQQDVIDPNSAARNDPAADEANGQVAPNAPQAAPIGQMQLEPRQGRVMAANVPAGWSFSDTTNGVDISAPDGITWVAHTWLRGVGQCTPDSYLRQNMQMWGQWGISNVKVASAKDLNRQTKLYEMDYVFHGRAAHAAIQISVSPAPESYMAEQVFIQTAPETFQQNLPMLIEIIKSVRPIDNNAFCDNGKINGEIQKRANIRAQSAHDVAEIQRQGYEYRSHVQDQMNLQSSDTRRDQTRFDDNGTQVTAPLQAERVFRHGDGSYSYSTNNTDAAPADATEVPQYQYR